VHFSPIGNIDRVQARGEPAEGRDQRHGDENGEKKGGE